MSTEKKMEWLLGLVVIILTGVLSAGYSYAANTSKEPPATIVIDAGHGGYDPGKVAINDALEKDINLLIAEYLKEYMEEEGFKVVMTRTSDEDLQDNNSSYRKQADLNKRCEIIENENADYTISIHQNSFSDSSVNGAQVFYYAGSKEGETLAKYIQASLKENIDENNNRKAKSSDDYYIIKNSACPTVIVECGFLSNRAEADKLCETSYQKDMAKAICKGFVEYFSEVSK